MFKLPLVICLICSLAVLYCQAEVTATNNIQKKGNNKDLVSPLVGEVDLVYCLFDTSSISVTESSSTQQQKYHEEFEKGRYVESFTRHRTLSYLRYFLRGVTTNMPWIRKLIVVMPEYDRVSPIIADNPAVTVIRHRDFIPKVYIPVFNEQTVLLFLHLIPNISREFIYMNQHMYPIAPLTPQHFKSVPQDLTLVPIRVQRENPIREPHEISAIDNALSMVVHGPSTDPQHVTGLDYDDFAPMLFDTHVMQVRVRHFAYVTDLTPQRIVEYYQQHVTDTAYNKFPSPSDISFKHLYVHYLIKKEQRASLKQEHELVPSSTVHVSNWTQISFAKLQSNNITVLHVSHELLRAPWKTQDKDPLSDMLGALYNQVRSPYEADMQYIEVRGLLLGLALIGLFVSCTLGVTFHFDLWRSPRRAHGTKIA